MEIFPSHTHSSHREHRWGAERSAAINRLNISVFLMGCHPDAVLNHSTNKKISNISLKKDFVFHLSILFIKFYYQQRRTKFYAYDFISTSGCFISKQNGFVSFISIWKVLAWDFTMRYNFTLQEYCLILHYFILATNQCHDSFVSILLCPHFSNWVPCAISKCFRGRK